MSTASKACLKSKVYTGHLSNIFFNTICSSPQDLFSSDSVYLQLGGLEFWTMCQQLVTTMAATRNADKISTFNSLPSEVKERIASQVRCLKFRLRNRILIISKLPSKSSNCDLLSFCQVSRNLFGVGSPVLYRDIDLRNATVAQMDRIMVQVPAHHASHVRTFVTPSATNYYRASPRYRHLLESLIKQLHCLEHLWYRPCDLVLYQ